ELARETPALLLEATQLAFEAAIVLGEGPQLADARDQLDDGFLEGQYVRRHGRRGYTPAPILRHARDPRTAVILWNTSLEVSKAQAKSMESRGIAVLWVDVGWPRPCISVERAREPRREARVMGRDGATTWNERGDS
ncbi:MAG: hypothetical protein QOI41_1284, partial [Myxococcales bacterium]|nr:hypothetical protein [Myxococcales bacterium]